MNAVHFAFTVLTLFGCFTLANSWPENPEGANLCNKEGLPASPCEINP